MAALTAANVTVTVNPEDVDRSPDGRIGIRTFPVVAFGNGALTYPALGVPMPAIGKFGPFYVALKRVYIEQPANGFIYHFDRANHKLRIFLGSAIGAITVANATQTGNVAATPAASGGTPAGNVVEAAHAHDLTILANNAGAGVGVIVAMANTANHALVSDTAAGDVIPGGNVANKGGVGSTTPANATFTGVALATHVHGAQSFTGDAHTHALVGAGGAAEAALAEMDSGVAPAATTLYMECVGR